MNKFQPIIEQAGKLLAKEQYQDALELYQSIEQETKLSPVQQSSVLLAIGDCYTGLNNYEQAKEYLTAALKRAELREKLDDQRSIIHSLALVEKKFGHYDEAVKLFRKELSRICSNFENFFDVLAENYYQQGMLMMTKEDYPDSRMYLNHSITYAVRNPDIKGRALSALGRLNVLQNKRKDALKTYRMAYENFKLANNRQGVSEVLKMINEYEKNYKFKFNK